jgi:DNA-binding protein HU-beta
LVRADIVREVMNRTGLTEERATCAVKAFFESIKKALLKGERVELKGFAIFNVCPRKTGVGRNPRTGVELKIAPGKVVRFRPGKELQTLD